MEQNNTFKTLAYVAIGLVVVIGGVILLTKHKKSADENMVIGMAKVDSIEISKTDSFPVGVNIMAKGYLSDSCTKLGEIKQTYANGTFNVVIESKKPQNAKACAEVIQNFEQTISLSGVAGLTKGTYSVDVNGVKGAFTLGMDNFINAADPLK
jgi:inhibitor of cysteine peptidase